MADPIITYQFDQRTVALILEGLAELPYKRVHAVMQGIAQHAKAMLNPPAPETPAAPESDSAN